MKEERKEKRQNVNQKRRKVSHKQDRRTEDREWMTTPPKEGKDEEIITKEGKEWAWCNFHKKWVVYRSKFGIHTSKTCRLNPNNNVNKDKKTKKPKVTVDGHQAQSEIKTGSEVSMSTSESESDMEQE